MGRLRVRDQVDKVDAWVRRAPLVVILLLAALLASSLFTLGDALNRALAFWDDTVQWREREYNKLGELQAGISLTKVSETLGEPTFVRLSEDGTLQESSFQGRDYWVQTISSELGTVLSLTVTSCDLAFRPSFESPTGDRVTLHETTFGAYGTGLQHYFLSGATANSYFFEEYPGGNPERYQSHAIGLNDACPWRDLDVLQPLLPASWGRGNVGRFREVARVNTYSVTGVGGSFMTLTADFGIGVDRILTRTLDPTKQALLSAN